MSQENVSTAETDELILQGYSVNEIEVMKGASVGNLKGYTVEGFKELLTDAELAEYENAGVLNLSQDRKKYFLDNQYKLRGVE